MANEMQWNVQSGFLTNNKLNKFFQKTAQPRTRFRQFVTIKEAFGKQKGETVNWLRAANVDDYGKKLIETSTVPETSQALTWGTLTVAEYGNSLPFTFKIETLSEFEIKDIIKGGLLDDHVKVADGLVERQFNACKYRYVGTGSDVAGVITSNGTATATNSAVLSSYHVRKMRLELEKLNVPTFDGDYVCIASLEAMENLEGELQTVNQYTETGYQKILNGEVGRLHGVRFVKDAFATRFTYDEDAGTATAKSWTNGLSLEAYMFGRDTVREALVVPEEIRMKVVTDYGRSKGMAWYMLGGWKINWETVGDCRIIKWDSAA